MQPPLIIEHFSTQAAAQTRAARLIQARVQFCFSSHEGRLAISYPAVVGTRAHDPPPRQHPPARAA